MAPDPIIAGAYASSTGILYSYTQGNSENPADVIAYTLNNGTLNLSQSLPLYSIGRGLVMSPQQNYVAIAAGPFYADDLDLSAGSAVDYDAKRGSANI